MIRSAGLIVFRQNKKGEVLFLLLCSRSGYWGFPKGRLEKQETNLDAAIREAQEEAGARSFFIVSGRRFSSVYRVPSGAPKTVVLYAAKTADGGVVISREHNAYRWASYADARALLPFATTRNLVKKCYEYIRQSQDAIARQEVVYRAAQKIPKGKVATYKTIALVAGKGMHARTVGVILGNNYDMRVPCHRVVSSDGSIGGYNRGIFEKIKKLKQEGVAVKHRKGVACIDLKQYDHSIR